MKVISKTKIMSGFQCERMLYYQIHRPRWARPISASEQFLFDQGHQVGAEARKRFPGGRLIDVPAWEFDRAVAETSKAMTGTVFEAAFQNGPLFVRADILEKTPEGWNLIEVKSSTSVKEEHILDCATQYVVLRGLKIPIQKVQLMHINRECRAPNLSNLFTLVDITEEVLKKTSDIKKSVAAFLDLLKKPQPPDRLAGPQCESPYDCRFQKNCWKDQLIPEFSVLNLPDLSVEAKWKLFHEGQSVQSLDVSEYSDIVKRAVSSYKMNAPVIDKEQIQSELNQWKRPFWFLDFETIGSAVPMFDGTRPYEQVPFQYSLHVQSEAGGGLRHEEFLDTSGEDPRLRLIEKLLCDIGPEGDIIAYYAPFEKKVISALAESFPQYAERLEALLPRFRDPYPLIKSSMYYPEFLGSFSLKSVGPALLGKDFSYKDLQVQDGSMAQAAYLQCVRQDSEELKGAMREYCARDTLILVRVLEELLRIVQTS